ncbi:phosphoribosylglycinamide formyltransferase [Nitrosophilus alvini]|uniref:phosphoribosylglycinamide formyltransferase n=1 Tax=Nitrosophilus alvini TaxID=2714855 RepID=UPI00190C07D1|nr:phosphoribosylglycinamide formyltransferase [Nitrosophilus alvini]
MLVKRVVVLFSGKGTNLKNLIQKVHKKRFGDITIEIAAAITNNEKAEGINVARSNNISVDIILHDRYSSREEFDGVLVEKIKKYSPDLVVLAGFMRILSPVFTDNIKNAINIHPSLLPLFKGTKAIERSYASDMKVAGATVHRVSSELDSGEILEQECFHRENESFEEFEAKIHAIEYEILPKTVIKLLKK